MTGRIVVGVDGSEGARRALAWAVAEARLRGAELRAVWAWSYLDQPAERFDPHYGEDEALRELDAAVEAVLGEAGAGGAGGADGGAAGAPIERVVVNDLPVRALLDQAAGADLLVVGARGLGGVKGLLLGSVSQQLAQRAPCPVVIVPGDERTGEGA